MMVFEKLLIEWITKRFIEKWIKKKDAKTNRKAEDRNDEDDDEGGRQQPALLQEAITSTV